MTIGSPSCSHAGQPVHEVLEDVGEGRLHAQEAVERLREVDDDEQRGRDRQPDSMNVTCERRR